MSIRSSISDRQNRQPAILSRKRKAEKELVASPCSEFSSPPSSSTLTSSSCETTPTTDTDMSADETSINHRFSASSLKEFRALAKLLHPFSNACRRSSPLPELDWAEQKELWHSMVLKDTIYTRNPKLLKQHPDLQPLMRSILFDWLSEVCEVYALHRETFHLAMDYVDRFLMLKPNLPKNYLQLLGITSLFVASKMEEIYPPKLEQFAYVTAGACSESDILAQEIVLIMTLNWNLSPMTANCWLNIFMQLAFLEDGENLIGREKFPRNVFLQISQVLDICMLDIESLKFPYSILTASAMAHFISKETAMHVSGLNWNDLLSCVVWMKPFVEISFENPVPDVKLFHDVSADDAHNIQTHSAGLKLLDAVHQKKRIMKIESSPSIVLREMTPPQSSKKPHIMDVDE